MPSYPLCPVCLIHHRPDPDCRVGVPAEYQIKTLADLGASMGMSYEEMTAPWPKPVDEVYSVTSPKPLAYLDLKTGAHRFVGDPQPEPWKIDLEHHSRGKQMDISDVARVYQPHRIKAVLVDEFDNFVVREDDDPSDALLPIKRLMRQGSVRLHKSLQRKS